MIKSKRQNNIKLMTLMIAVARQAKPANVNADGLRHCLLDRQLYLFMNLLILLMLYKWTGMSALTKCYGTNAGRRESLIQ